MRHSIPISILFYCLAFPCLADSLEELQLLVEQKKYSTAIQSAEKLLAHQGQHPRVMFLTAYAYQMNRQIDKAESLYRQLISEYPNLPEPRNNLAMIYQDRGDYDAASKLLVEAIETHNSYATAYRNLSRIYKGIASEAYRRALSESSEPASYSHKIELSALNQLDTLTDIDNGSQIAMQTREESPEIDIKTVLTERVKQWAKAWSEKDFTAYTGYYSTDHRPNFATHNAWLEYRRERIMRPGFIRIDVKDIQIRAQTHNRAIIDFKQSFDSPNYSDRVIKRLEFRQFGTQWKIVDERVLSVL